MMSTKVMNIRNTHTKESLKNAFIQLVSKKDFEKITIADISKTARVNRSTFYSHFNDKYDLLEYIMGDSAATAIEKNTNNEFKFDLETIVQLVIAVCDFYEKPNFTCRSSYISLVVPQLKEKTVTLLSKDLSRRLSSLYTELEMMIYVPIFAQIIHEGAIQWVTSDMKINKEEFALKVAKLVIGGYESSK